MSITVQAYRTPVSGVCLLAALVFGTSDLSAADRNSTPKGPGDKVEFTAPYQIGPLRPTAGYDPDSSRYGAGRGDSDAVASQLPPGFPLPAPDDGSRLRLLQQLFERRLGMSSGLPGESGLPGVSLDDPDGTGGASMTSGVDDLFDRPSRSRDRRDRDNAGSGPGDRPTDDLSNRRRDEGREGLGDSGSANGGLGSTRLDSGRGDGTGRLKREDGFLPSMDSRSLSVSESERERSGRSDSFLDPSSLLNRRVLMREMDNAAAERRDRRAEEWNRLLGRSPGSSERSLFPTPAGGVGRAGNGVTAVPGLAVPGAGPSRNAMEAVGTRTPEASVPGAASMPEQPSAAIGRLGGLDLGLGGRNAARSTFGTAGTPAAAPRPMDLFRQKHDTSIPTRGF